MDVIELDAASNRGIDEVRDLRENVRFAPSSCRFKVYIIDEAHQLTREAFNALLKTLEEPPPHAKFILATTEAEKMPDTIVSRCQQFRFKPLSLQRIVENLRAVVKSQEQVPIPGPILDETLFLIARTSEGGMRDALSLFDQVMSLADESLTLEEVELVLGGVRLSTLFDLTGAIRRRDVLKALEMIHTSYEQGQDPALLVRDLLAHFRNLMVGRTAPENPELIGLPPDQVQTLVAQAKEMSMEDLLQGIDILFEAERRLRVTGSARAVCEAAVVKLALMPTTVEIEALLGRTDLPLANLRPSTPNPAPSAASNAKQEPTPGPAPEKVAVDSAGPERAKAKPAPTAREENTNQVEADEEETPEKTDKGAGIHIHMADEPDRDLVDTLLDRWEAICHKVTEKNVSIGGHLTDAVPHAFDGNELVLLLHEDLTFHLKQLRSPEAREALEQVLTEEIGIRPKIRVETANSEEMSQVRLPALDQEVPPTRQLPSMDEIVRSEPVVQTLLDQFDGVVIEVRDNPNQ